MEDVLDELMGIPGNNNNNGGLPANPLLTDDATDDAMSIHDGQHLLTTDTDDFNDEASNGANIDAASIDAASIDGVANINGRHDGGHDQGGRGGQRGRGGFGPGGRRVGGGFGGPGGRRGRGFGGCGRGGFGGPSAFGGLLQLTRNQRRRLNRRQRNYYQQHYQGRPAMIFTGTVYQRFF